MKKNMKKQIVIIATILISIGHVNSQVRNGLNNTVGAPFTEMGGDLIRHTNVNLFNSSTSTPYNLAFTNEGVFGVGNTITSSSLLGYNGTNSKSVFSYNNSTTTNANPFYNTIGAYFNSNYTMSSDVTGIINNVNAKCASNRRLRGMNMSVTGAGLEGVGVDISLVSIGLGAITNGYGVRASSSGAGNNFGSSFGANTSGPGSAYGVSANGRGGNENFGGYLVADSGSTNWGANCEARNLAKVAHSTNIGARGIAEGAGFTSNNADFNMGVLGVGDYAPTSIGVCGFLGVNAYLGRIQTGVQAAVYGNSQYSSGLYGTPYAGYFDGDVNINGIGTITGGIWSPSDKTLKKEITPITDARSILAKLQPKSYFYNNANEYGLSLNERKDYGIIAQDLEEVLPELVRTISKPERKDAKGNVISKAKTYKVVNHTALIGILIASSNEQQKIIDEQKQINQSLQQQIDDLKTNQVSSYGNKITTGINQVNGTGSDFSMDQNIPNPFNGETVVKYNLPSSVNNAYMAVYDLSGKQITTFPINQKGSSSITLTSEKLAAGIYIYSIIADGKIMDSKRMIVADK